MAGIVVEHKENGVMFAISERNFNPKVHKKVRDLKDNETVIGFRPKPRRTITGEAPADNTPTESKGPSAGTKEAK